MRGTPCEGDGGGHVARNASGLKELTAALADSRQRNRDLRPTTRLSNNLNELSGKICPRTSRKE